MFNDQSSQAQWLRITLHFKQNRILGYRLATHCNLPFMTTRTNGNDRMAAFLKHYIIHKRDAFSAG
jgi:hypothetical protein